MQRPHGMSRIAPYLNDLATHLSTSSNPERRATVKEVASVISRRKDNALGEAGTCLLALGGRLEVTGQCLPAKQSDVPGTRLACGLVSRLTWILASKKGCHTSGMILRRRSRNDLNILIMVHQQRNSSTSKEEPRVAERNAKPEQLLY